jgi:phosphatidylglycerophosphate synthase
MSELRDMKYGNDMDFESPFDTFFFHPLASKTLDLYKEAGLTPNKVTTLSLVSSLLSAYYLYKREYLTAAVLYILNYYFDCVDGRLARRYNMKSDIGEAYDALSDNIGVAVLLAVMFDGIKSEYTLYLAILAGIVSIILNYWFVSNEQQLKGVDYYETTESRLKDLPINKAYSEYIKRSHKLYELTKDYIPGVIRDNIKYFGSGTANILIAVIIYNIGKYFK